MEHTFRKSFPVILLALALCAACDPQAPGSTGKLTVSPQASLAAGRSLEIRFLPDDGSSFDVLTADLTVMYPRHESSWSMAEVRFPFQYEIGGGLGSSEHEHWRVLAWIAESDEPERPLPGEWYGTRKLSVEDCGLMISGYCGVAFDMDFAIDFVVPGPSSHEVGAEPGPGEYIEQRYGEYAIRSMEGSDTARSIGTYIIRIAVNGQPVTSHLPIPVH